MQCCNKPTSKDTIQRHPKHHHAFSISLHSNPNTYLTSTPTNDKKSAKRGYVEEESPLAQSPSWSNNPPCLGVSVSMFLAMPFPARNHRHSISHSSHVCAALSFADQGWQHAISPPFQSRISVVRGVAEYMYREIVEWMDE